MLLWTLRFWSWTRYDTLVHKPAHWYTVYLHDDETCARGFSPGFEAHPRLGGVSWQKESQHVCSIHNLWLKIAIFFKTPWKTSLKAVQCPFRKNNSPFSRVFGVGVRSASLDPEVGSRGCPPCSCHLLSLCFSCPSTASLQSLSMEVWRGSSCSLIKKDKWNRLWVKGQIFSSVISRNCAYTSLEHSPLGLKRNL